MDRVCPEPMVLRANRQHVHMRSTIPEANSIARMVSLTGRLSISESFADAAAERDDFSNMAFLISGHLDF
jgi:hypothetical protein